MFKLLLFALFLSFTAFAGEKSYCENGECIPPILNRLENLSRLYEDECFASDATPESITTYLEKHGLSERCWRIMTEIKYYDEQLVIQRSKLENSITCEGENCKATKTETILIENILNIRAVQVEMSCNEVKKQRTIQTCMEESSCVLFGPVVEIAQKLNQKLHNYRPATQCNGVKDQCLTHIATAFAHSAMAFFDGLWELMKIGGKKIWQSMAGAEDHSSSAQLAMAKASEDPSVFKMIMDDFPGAMAKAWNIFVLALKGYLRENLFCQEWSGAPHLSKCLKPSERWDCVSCKAMLSGVFCALPGALAAEAIPAFIFGGFVEAIKYGVHGVGKLVQVIKFSPKSMDTLKASRMATTMSAVKGSVVGKSTAFVLDRLNRYLLSPTRKVVKTTVNVVSDFIKDRRVYMASTPTGKILAFPGKLALASFKVAIFPIENPLTIMAYNMGARTFHKAFRLAPKVILPKTAIISTLVSNDKSISEILSKLELAQLNRASSAEIVALQKELYGRVLPHREKILRSLVVSPEPDMDEVFKILYPELKYGEFAKSLSPDQVARAERDYYYAINTLPDSPGKQKFLEHFRSHINGSVARAQIVPGQFEFTRMDAQHSNVLSPLIRPMNIYEGIELFAMPVARVGRAVRTEEHERKSEAEKREKRQERRKNRKKKVDENRSP